VLKSKVELFILSIPTQMIISDYLNLCTILFFGKEFLQAFSAELPKIL